MTAKLDVEGLLAESRRARTVADRRRTTAAVGVSVGVTIIWLAYVTLADHWARALENWPSAVTMIFGSFVAGSTPQGGGAVAFPVFTKLLNVSSDVARTFSLCIQTVGMGAATLSIIIRRRRVDLGALAYLIPSALVGFGLALLLLVDRTQPFWPARIPGAYVKVTFTVVLAAMAFVVFLAYRPELLERRDEIRAMTNRLRVSLVLAGLVGGVGSALVGSGADVASYVTIAILIGINPRVGVPSSVIVMTAVSVAGFLVVGLGAGQLDVGLTPDGSAVATVDGRAVIATDDGVRFSDTLAPSETVGGDRQPAKSETDLFGIWLAAIPIVAWGAPLGSAIAARFSDRSLVRFVIALAALEVVSTLVFLRELYSNPSVATYGVVLSIALIGGLWLLARHRSRVLGLDEFDVRRAVTPSRIDVTDDYGPGLVGERSGGRFTDTTARSNEDGGSETDGRSDKKDAATE